jgi:hypothetical protein
MKTGKGPNRKNRDGLTDALRFRIIAWVGEWRRTTS